MRTTSKRLIMTISAVLCLVPGVRAAKIDFETVPVGTVYGEPANNTPGEIVLSQDGINMSVELFRYGGTVDFYRAEISGRYGGFFPTTPAELVQISLLFDFTNIGFDANLVTLDYMEFGGASNFSVNDHQTLEIDSLGTVPTDIAPGVTAWVGPNSITLTGEIDRFLIGGQELAIDNVVVVPEPASLVLLGAAAAVGWCRRSRRPLRRRKG